jgi:hypothetical protein
MVTTKEKRPGMEIETTIRDSLKTLKQFPPDTPIKIIIQDLRKDTESSISTKGDEKKPHLPFLDDNNFWDSENTPTDLSVNVDKYLYGDE